MTDIQLFNFKDNEVRVVIIDNAPWFVAKDVCDVLDNPNVTQVLTRLKDYEKREVIINDVTGRNQDMAIVSESGLYRLILTSRKPQAEPFQDWVCQEVLPTIRKTGKYEIPKQPKLDPERVTAEVTVNYTKSIFAFQNNGDLQLAQLLKSHFGNVLLAQQQLNDGTYDVQVEGAVEVAIRLNIRVPKNLESSLGKYVKSRCEDLLVGKNSSYNHAAFDKVWKNMYPANHPQVEKAVLEFAALKSLPFNS